MTSDLIRTPSIKQQKLLLRHYSWGLEWPYHKNLTFPEANTTICLLATQFLCFCITAPVKGLLYIDDQGIVLYISFHHTLILYSFTVDFTMFQHRSSFRITLTLLQIFKVKSVPPWWGHGRSLLWVVDLKKKKSQTMLMRAWWQSHKGNM